MWRNNIIDFKQGIKRKYWRKREIFFLMMEEMNAPFGSRGITVFSWDHSILVGSQYFSLCDDNLTISCGEITLLTLNRENIF